MRFLTALLVAVWGLLTACSTGVTTAVPAPLSIAGARSHVLPGYIRGSKESHADRVIVFIHGVFGDGTSTWTNPTTGAYFPALIRDDKAFDGVDIWVHEFDTPKLRRTYTIDELADHLRKYLNNDNVIANHRQVIFVCHSLGGLVARAYLLKYRLPVSQVPMIYFFSTPTTGADVATLASFISANPQLTDMRKMTTDSPGTIGTWQAQWVASEYNHATLSYCGYETLPIHGVQIVQRESATNLCNTRFDPIRRDHIAIVKPADNTSDESYVAFREAYRETFEHHSDLARSPLWNLTSKDAALLRVQNVTQQHDCTSICWSDHVAVAPGDDITFNLSYRNAGLTTAKDARVYLSIPRAPLVAMPIMARLVAANAETTYGMVTLVTTSGPVLLIPTDAFAYEGNDATKTHEPPYRQRAAALASEEGWRLEDVIPEEAHHHIVVRFHCEPVMLVGIANIEETLFPIAQHVLSTAIETGVLHSPGGEGHIDSGDIGEHNWWVSDVRDVHNDGDLLLYLNHFNDTAKVQRHLRANVRLDPDDPSTLRLTLTSADGPIRSATARLFYRPGTTQRPILLGAYHDSKAPFELLGHLGSISDQEVEKQKQLALTPWPVHGDDIDLGDLPPQTQVTAAIPYGMGVPGSQAEPEALPPEQQTVLNGADGEVVLKVANTPVHSSAWSQYLPGFKSEWPLWIAITAHNTGHAIARDVRLHLSMDVTTDQLEARGRVTARNAPEQAGVARVAFVPRSPRMTFYYDQGYLFRSGTTHSRNLDASRITAEGVEIGDLDPDEWIFLSIGFIAGSSAPEDAAEDLVMTPERYFETLLPLDNTTTKTMHDVVLFTHTAGGPEEVLVTTTLSSAGQVLRSKNVRLHASVPGITLRYSNATVFAATGAKPIDASNASGKGVFIGDLPPGAQMIVRVGYEVLSPDD